MLFLFRHDSCEDAATVNAEATGREEAVVEGIGTEGTDVNGSFRDARRDKVVSIRLPEVDVPAEWY